MQYLTPAQLPQKKGGTKPNAKLQILHKDLKSREYSWMRPEKKRKEMR